MTTRFPTDRRSTHRVEPPTRTDADGATRFDHPAFGQLQLSRISGRYVPYGSDHVHYSFVRLRLSRSQLVRSGHRTDHRARDVVAEVSLTEAQWLALISSPNVGEGVPCTLVCHRTGDPTVPPGLPDPTPRSDAFREAVGTRLGDALGQLDALRDEVAESRLSGAARAALLNRVDAARRAFTDDVPYLVEAFDRYVEAVGSLSFNRDTTGDS